MKNLVFTVNEYIERARRASNVARAFPQGASRQSAVRVRKAEMNKAREAKFFGLNDHEDLLDYHSK